MNQMNEFHNTGWDPYQQLMENQHNVQQLIIGHNNNQALLADLVEQHRQMITLIKSTKIQYELLRNEVNLLRQQNSQ